MPNQLHASTYAKGNKMIPEIYKKKFDLKCSRCGKTAEGKITSPAFNTWYYECVCGQTWHPELLDKSEPKPEYVFEELTEDDLWDLTIQMFKDYLSIKKRGNTAELIYFKEQWLEKRGLCVTNNCLFCEDAKTTGICKPNELFCPTCQMAKVDLTAHCCNSNKHHKYRTEEFVKELEQLNKIRLERKQSKAEIDRLEKTVESYVCEISKLEQANLELQKGGLPNKWEKAGLSYCKEHRTIHCSCQQKEIDRLEAENKELKEKLNGTGV